MADRMLEVKISKLYESYSLVRKKTIKNLFICTTTLIPPENETKEEIYHPFPFLPLISSNIAEILKSKDLRAVYYHYIQIGKLLSNEEDTNPSPSSPHVVFTSLGAKIDLLFVLRIAKERLEFGSKTMSAPMKTKIRQSPKSRHHFLDFGHQADDEELLQTPHIAPFQQ